MRDHNKEIIKELKFNLAMNAKSFRKDFKSGREGGDKKNGKNRPAREAVWCVEVKNRKHRREESG